MSKPTVLHECKNNLYRRRIWAESLFLLAENQAGVNSKSGWAPLRWALQQEQSGKEQRAKREGWGQQAAAPARAHLLLRLPKCQVSGKALSETQGESMSCGWQWNTAQYPKSDVVATLWWSQEKMKTYEQCSERRGCIRRWSISKQLATPKHFISYALRLTTGGKWQ